MELASFDGLSVPTFFVNREAFRIIGPNIRLYFGIMNEHGEIVCPEVSLVWSREDYKAALARMSRVMFPRLRLVT